MKFKTIDHFITGTAIPVSSLWSENSCGIGEFYDLLLLGEWCHKVGLDLIQILPVNDTGYQSSPYSALSAYALHPNYIRLTEIPGHNKYIEEINKLKKKSAKKSIDFNGVLKAKLGILNKIYKANQEKIIKDPKLATWIKDNPWVVIYAVYSQLKIDNKFKRWQDWPKMKEPSQDDIQAFWDNNIKKVMFFAWVQMHLEAQLHHVAQELEKLDVCLKGDLPILMNFDSADVWAEKSFFRTELQAGAPPDMFSEDGQSWGFPIYDWKALEEADFIWWKNRLKQADKFYHAYRIDHVLGFFRIWSIPETDYSGSLGYFSPSIRITEDDLNKLHFDKGRIAWLSETHIYEHELRDTVDEDEADDIIDKCLERISDEPLFLLKEKYRSEVVLWDLPYSHEAKEFLVQQHRDRTLLKTDDGNYSQNWFYARTKAFHCLSHEEKHSFEAMLTENHKKAEAYWADHGRQLLQFMKNTTPMLVCAEDLGVVPPCVPEVLHELGILSLKVVRWTRRYDQEGHPFIPIDKYHQLSVCTPSVHDTSSLRGWWAEDEDKTPFLKSLVKPPKIKGDAKSLSTAHAKKVIAEIFKTSSLLCVFQIQDFFALHKNLRINKVEDERINTPGTVNETNWSYKIPVTLEQLLKEEEFNQELTSLVEKRKHKAFML